MKRSVPFALLALCASALSVVSCSEDDEPQGPVGQAGSPLLPDAGDEPELPEGARGPNNPPQLGPRIDRAGRVAITAALVGTFNPADQAQLRAAYNSADNSNVPSDLFLPEMEASLAILDGLDRQCGNQLNPGGEDDTLYSSLAGVLIDDQLYVNSDASGSIYLGVEAQFLGAIPDGAGGGRIPSDDVVERSYSVLIAGALFGTDDGVTGDDQQHDPGAFPFLAAPAN